MFFIEGNNKSIVGKGSRLFIGTTFEYMYSCTCYVMSTIKKVNTVRKIRFGYKLLLHIMIIIIIDWYMLLYNESFSISIDCIKAIMIGYVPCTK